MRSYSATGLLLLLAGCGGTASHLSPAGASLTLSASSLAFPATTADQTSASQKVTLTNNGSASLSLASITLSDTTDYSMTSTCGATLAAGATCGLTVTFTPSAGSVYTASITVTGDASHGPWIVSLSGQGTAVSITHTFYVIPESDGVTPLYALLNGAQKSIDMTIYGLDDTTFSGDLVAACNRGVKVRVLLDQNTAKTVNAPAFNQLNAAPNCSAEWANTVFPETHQKSFIVDGTQVAIMSLNLIAADYSFTRDYALVENDPEDIAAIQATFDADYAAGTTAAGVVGTSDFGYQPGLGDAGSVPGGDLIWSPTNAQIDMLAIIDNAKATLLIEAEEMDAPNIVSALVTACENHIQVHITMSDDSADYGTEFSELQAAGCGLYLYPLSGTLFYVHAKAAIADYGLPTQTVYMGSINYHVESMTENRELGIFITDPASAQLLYKTMASDYAGNGTVY
ncbi:MAG TPA: phospholipase D-like domain-containing protein [Terracidiphilus sp.]